MRHRILTWLKPRSKLKAPIKTKRLGELPSMLTEHGFKYVGFSEPDDRMHGSEDHYFLSNRCALIFGFAYSMYGSDTFEIGDPVESVNEIRNMVPLSNFIPDIRRKYFAFLLKNDGIYQVKDPAKSEGDALVASISETLEDAIDLFQRVRTQGRHLPLRIDRGPEA